MYRRVLHVRKLYSNNWNWTKLCIAQVGCMPNRPVRSGHIKLLNHIFQYTQTATDLIPFKCQLPHDYYQKMRFLRGLSWSDGCLCTIMHIRLILIQPYLTRLGTQLQSLISPTLTDKNIIMHHNQLLCINLVYR